MGLILILTSPKFELSELGLIYQIAIKLQLYRLRSCFFTFPLSFRSEFLMIYASWHPGW